MSTKELLEEQNRLLKALVKMMLQQYTEDDVETAKMLHEMGFKHKEIAELIGKSRSSVTKYLS